MEDTVIKYPRAFLSGIMLISTILFFMLFIDSLVEVYSTPPDTTAQSVQEILAILSKKKS